MKKLNFTKKSVISFILASLLPFAIMILGTSLLIKGCVLTLSLFLAYYLIPLLLIGCIFALAFLNVKSLFKILIAILILVLIFFFFAINLLGQFEIFRSYEGENAIEHYENEMSDFALPTSDSISKAKSTEFYEFSTFLAIFGSDSYILICDYDDAEYSNQKNELSNKYKFYTQTITHPDKDYPQPYNVEPTSEIKGYSFKVVDERDKGDSYTGLPKHIKFVGTNDATNEIVYISFWNDDLDYIDNLHNFISIECGFKRIR